MTKPRRRPPRRLSDLPRLVVPVGMGLVLAFCAWGFVHFTAIVLYKQAHFAPGAEHPDDGYAAGCLFLGMIALAGIFLSLRDPAPTRWRRPRRGRLRRGRLRRGRQRLR